MLRGAVAGATLGEVLHGGSVVPEVHHIVEALVGTDDLEIVGIFDFTTTNTWSTLHLKVKIN